MNLRDIKKISFRDSDVEKWISRISMKKNEVGIHTQRKMNLWGNEEEKSILRDIDKEKWIFRVLMKKNEFG